jgi:acetyl-CoA carboxylase biotin carboxyl carrier protein
VNLEELKEILQILEDQAITDFELEQQGTKIRVRRASRVTPASRPPVPRAVSVAPEAPSAAPLPAAGPAPPPEESGLTVVKSPIVGTFYRAPDPNSPPFVSVGDTVRVGQVLCIIEAMKLMNEIEAEVAGEIVKVHHDSGQPVQYGEPLFTVRPAS